LEKGVHFELKFSGKEREMKEILRAALFGVLLFFLPSLVAASETAPPENQGVPETQAAIQEKFLLKLEVIDRTAGQALAKEQLANIREEIIRQIKAKYPSLSLASAESEKADAVLKVYVDVFTAGNRALRFWIGFGAGKAHMKMTAEWLDGDPPQLKASKEYQRFGAASMKSGEDIELIMRELIGQYSVEFMDGNIRK
jgi:hypothetical protein